MSKRRTGLELLQRGIKPSTRYRVIIKGDWFKKANKGTEQVPYRAAFLTTEKQCRETSAIFQFVNYVAPTVMKSKPGYLGLATHELESCTVESGEDLQNPDLMTRSELALFAKDMELEIDLSLYPDRVDLLNAVKECFEDPEGFEKNQEARRARKSKALQAQSELDELNKNGVQFLAFDDEIEESEYDREYQHNRYKDELTRTEERKSEEIAPLISNAATPPKPVGSKDETEEVKAALEESEVEVPEEAAMFETDATTTEQSEGGAAEKTEEVKAEKGTKKKDLKNLGV